MVIDLSGRRALVTGASQGIGAAIAQTLANAGAEVCLVARNSEKLETLCKSLKPGPHQWLSLDATARSAFIDAIHQQHKQKPFDILVLNSGGPKSGPITEARPHDFMAAMEQHLVINSELAQMAEAHMKRQLFGRILTVTSTSVRMPIPGLGVSNTVRAAVASWMKTIAFELAPFGITVNNLMPGYMMTDRLESLLTGASQKMVLPENEVAEIWKKSVPAGRFGEPSEMGYAAAFLCSEYASYITGVNLPVDGGRIGAL